jgi:hypothetical protein
MDDCDNDDDRDGDVDAIHLIISKEGVVKENLIDCCDPMITLSKECWSVCAGGV